MTVGYHIPPDSIFVKQSHISTFCSGSDGQSSWTAHEYRHGSDVCAIHCSVFRYLTTLFQPFSAVSDKRVWYLMAGQSGSFWLSEIFAWPICIKRRRTNYNEYQWQLSSEGRAGSCCSTAVGLSECHQELMGMTTACQSPSVWLPTSCSARF